MLMEIVSTFGLLRSYHFEFNEELHASTAFLEYADHSNTTKACAGLNGIKLGGRVLTAVRAIPDHHHHQEKEAGGATVSYIIPDHAKPLLADPTPVLQLKSLFDRDELLLLSEAELDEVLEDVRLEYARFGTVKSVNLVRYDNSSETATEVEQNLNGESPKTEAGAEMDNIDSNQNGDLQPMEKVKGENEAVNIVSGSPPACFNIGRSVKSETYDSESVLASDVTKLDVGDGDGERAHDVNTYLNTTDDAAMSGDFGANGQAGNPSIFEVGCVLVEYSRAEASCAAAHCLHGRLFGEKTVVGGYVPHDLYLAQFLR